MSKTLFWYLLRDMLKIFLLASGSLAGIMSFGALLRPLTQHGLDASQVGRILSYFSPAMTTYSFPLAALFATTIVYGRLSADNELTACRATGISHLAMTWPAVLLGLLVALISLLFLSFIVPRFTLKVEQVIYSNVAQLVSNKITRTHELSFGKTTIFAQGARVVPGEGDRQVVELDSPVIFTYQTVDAPDAPAAEKGEKPDKAAEKARRMRVPARIWMARRATAYISREGDAIVLEATLEDGGQFTRGTGGRQLVVEEAQFGPIPLGSPIRENTKFMDITQLKALLTRPENSRLLQGTVRQMIRDEQRAAYFAGVKQSLEDPALRSYRFIAETETLVVSGLDLDVTAREGELVITPNALLREQAERAERAAGPEGAPAAPGTSGAPAGDVPPAPRDRRAPRDPDAPAVRVDRESNGVVAQSLFAKQVRITLDPLEASPEGARRMLVSADTFDVIVQAGEDPAAHQSLRLAINVPMPDDLSAMERRTAEHYLRAAGDRSDRTPEFKKLKDDYARLLSTIRAEMHSRVSFAISCFILVVVGCALGMISRSGNFLSAFAVSAVPALLCIALIVTGQHTCENSPKAMTLGLSLIWSGNVAVAVLAVTLLWKLQRQ